MASFLEKLVGGTSDDYQNAEPDSEKGVLDQISEATTLSYKQRIIGFITLYALGVVLGILSGFFVLLIVKKPAAFAITFTCSNICYLASTMVLAGPAKQFKKMFKKQRMISTSLFLVSMGLCLFSALYLRNAGLTIIFIIAQTIALFWYSISYIPGAQSCFKSTVKKCVC